MSRLGLVDLNELPGEFRERMRLSMARQFITLARRNATYGDPECIPLVGPAFEDALNLLAKACAQNAGHDVSGPTVIMQIVGVLTESLGMIVDPPDEDQHAFFTSLAERIASVIVNPTKDN